MTLVQFSGRWGGGEEKQEILLNYIVQYRHIGASITVTDDGATISKSPPLSERGALPGRCDPQKNVFPPIVNTGED